MDMDMHLSPLSVCDTYIVYLYRHTDVCICNHKYTGVHIYEQFLYVFLYREYMLAPVNIYVIL